ncbi:uncharacterized protein LACBIDRAFT_305329 [Laccaria bicolor S238N-H82]|uniref:Predicted protein n=1 Tax=Laccaria bicolor (strain S238N-H82 / ATCC MYA-4686) TaxID=486041 RepID=B0CTZ1_LACBS|nr:uncharacterized protein LACBIDRAFT_305329 [Laccaria bicolor S238N-H82]EDR13998.1 predicted protein [Laccaria bicolor S238N-H82]|eukprot:XP_001874557.1 predicted protein [Laccaria bicolor S238N-H82]
MPHRLPTLRRYKISNDVLILILEKLDPRTLATTCKVFRRVYELVMGFQHLRYKFELAMAGMQDGTPSYYSKPPSLRLQLLLAYRENWPKLRWTCEQKIFISAAATVVNVCGGFLYHVEGQTLDLKELPSYRTGRLPAQTKHIRFGTAPRADCVAIDPMQSLIVTSHTFSGHGGQVALRLKIRNLWTFEKHPYAASQSYECLTQVAQPVAKTSMVVCGFKMTVSLEFLGGTVKHLLIDWRTLQAMWLEEQDVHFLNPESLLTVGYSPRGSPGMKLFNIRDLNRTFIEREYELPSIWAGSELRFSHNAIPTPTVPLSRDALFHLDPLTRVLHLTVKGGQKRGALHWLFIKESYFRPASRADQSCHVPWASWSKACLIKDLVASEIIGVPRVIGSRIVYVESDSGSGKDRISIIDFAIPANHPGSSSRPWSLIGPLAMLTPNESSRSIPSSVTGHLRVEGICASEDNIVVMLEPQQGGKAVNILTFGPK